MPRHHTALLCTSPSVNNTVGRVGHLGGGQVATVVIEFKVVLPFRSFLSGMAVGIALDIVTSKGTKRYSEWLLRCLKSMLTPTPAADIAFPVSVSSHLILGLLFASRCIDNLHVSPCFFPHVTIFDSTDFCC